jgi:hypothetical protein
MNKLEPKPTSCVRPGCQLPRQSEQRSMTEEDLGEKKRKGRLGQTQGVGGSCAAFNPLGTRGAGKVQLNRQSSQLPNNVPCTDPVSQAIALTPHPRPSRSPTIPYLLLNPQKYSKYLEKLINSIWYQTLKPIETVTSTAFWPIFIS